jgi:hypothetical protein
MHCAGVATPRIVQSMGQRLSARKWIAIGMLQLSIALACGALHAEEPSAAAVAAFHNYVGAVETRMAMQHGQGGEFVVLEKSTAQTEARLRRGELIVESLTPTQNDLPGAMLHHWRGTAFLSGETAADAERLMRNFAAYPRIYAPEVVSAKVLSQNGDRYQAMMRVKQKHVITVVMDTTYDIEFGQVDARRGWSASRSTHIDEIDEAGTKKERVLSAGDQHGFLWRLNTYWSFEERDGGLFMQIESVSLTRSIPTGLGWVIGPFVESVPRESLEFTLRATRYPLRR